MEIQNCFYRISIKALILDETRTKFLVVQEEIGKWELPGGGMDWGETPEETLKRELHEEMGISILKVRQTPSYFLTGQFLSNAIWYANILYETEVEHLNFTPSNECIAVHFVTSDEARSLNAFPNIVLLADQFDPVLHISRV